MLKNAVQTLQANSKRCLKVVCLLMGELLVIFVEFKKTCKLVCHLIQFEYQSIF